MGMPSDGASKMDSSVEHGRILISSHPIGSNVQEIRSAMQSTLKAKQRTIFAQAKEEFSLNLRQHINFRSARDL